MNQWKGHLYHPISDIWGGQGEQTISDHCPEVSDVLMLPSHTLPIPGPASTIWL